MKMSVLLMFMKRRALPFSGWSTGQTVAHLPQLARPGQNVDCSGPVEGENDGLTLAAAVERAEKAAINAALHDANGNKTLAAKRLGITVRNLYYKLDRYALVSDHRDET